MSVSKAMRKAAKGANAQSRDLKGNRNSQGDFMPDEDIMFKKDNPEATNVPLQEYIDDAKAEIDGLTKEIQQIEVNSQADMDLQKSLMTEREVVIKELYHQLEINDVATPAEIRNLLDPLVGGGTDFDEGFGPDLLG